MVLKSELTFILNAQKDNFVHQDSGLSREVLPTLPDLTSHILIVSGIRRAGKSTLLFQLLKDKYKDALYLNFEDPRLYNFERSDFVRLDEIIKELNAKVLLFDEIQIIPEWEKYVRQKLDEGYRIVVTGSNASLLSRELGTKLTGRHITKELFPFSFIEFTTFLKQKPSVELVLDYLAIGGFPEYVKRQTTEILQHLFEDILIRDVAVRYSVRDIKSLQRLGLYLISNVGKLITGNRLKALFNISATSTIMEYLSHMEYAYLVQFVPKFSYSIRKQLVNPRKVYAIDTGLITVNSGSFSEDSGRKFENLVYLDLRRRFKEIYYFAEKGECDFIVFEKGNVVAIVQVCHLLNQDNLSRELSGMNEAMAYFKIKKGTIVTLEQRELIEENGNIVRIVPFHQWIEEGY